MRKSQKTFISIIFFVLIVLFSPSSFGNTLLGSWEGTYECNKKAKPIAIEIVDEFNARLSFFDTADDETAIASQWMEIWYRDKEIYLIGTEWIIKPRGWALSTLRLEQVDELSLEGSFIFRGCTSASLTKSEARAAQRAAEIKAQQQIPDTERFFTGQYQCSNQYTGSYWHLAPNANGYQINVTARARTNPRSERLYSIGARKAGFGLSGFDASGRFGVQLEFTEESNIPIGYWTTQNGLKDERCGPIEFSVAASPDQYWDSFFESAKKPKPSIDDVEKVTAEYQTLPSIKSLSTADTSGYAKERDRLWGIFSKNYIESLPDQIKALPLRTSEERAKARTLIARMENPGFRMQVNIPAHYANALFDNNVVVEPIYFVDEQAACARTNSFVPANSLQSVELFVGLSGFDWTDTSAAHFINLLKRCEASAQTVPLRVSTAIQRIEYWGAQVKRKMDVTSQLKDTVDVLNSKPRSLTTLVASNGYTTRAPSTNQMSTDTFNRLFESAVLPMREEALSNAMFEVNDLFSNSTTSGTGADLLEHCKKSLGPLYGKLPPYKAQLYEHCLNNARDHLSAYFKEAKVALETLGPGEQDTRSYLNNNRDFTTSSLANETGLQVEYKAFIAQRAAFANRILDSSLETIASYYYENTPDADAKLQQTCSQNFFNSTITSRCRDFLNLMTERQFKRQCNQTIEQAKLSDALPNNSVLYGDGVELRSISVKDLVCQAFLRGIALNINETSQALVIEGIALDSKQTLFETSMVNTEEKPDEWTVDSLSGTLPNTRFGEINQGQLVHCILSDWGC